MLYPLKLYFKHPATLSTIGLAALINGSIWAWLLWHIRPRAESIFLHYNILFGVDRIGNWAELLYLPLTGLSIMVINAIVGWLLFQRDKYAAYFLSAIALICQGFLFLAAARLVALNI